jgi:hypothetical protein
VKSIAKVSPDRLLVLVGDQLHPAHPLVAVLDPARDWLFMAEVNEKATNVWSHEHVSHRFCRRCGTSATILMHVVSGCVFRARRASPGITLARAGCRTQGARTATGGGYLASKPHVASGKYIERMGNYCKGCRYNPAHATGDDAFPYTTLYWQALLRHRERFAHHPGTALQWRNLERLDGRRVTGLRRKAYYLRNSL